VNAFNGFRMEGIKSQRRRSGIGSAMWRHILDNPGAVRLWLQLLYGINEPFLFGKGGDACKEMLIVNSWESESFNI
jgi:hypothetical protein